MDINNLKQLLNDNKHIEASAMVNQLITADPGNDELYYLKGKLMQKLNLWDAAITAYSKAIELNKDSKAVVALEMLYDILNALNNKIVDP